MRTKILTLAMLLSVVGGTAIAQQKKEANPKRYEAAEASKVIPEIRTFVTPNICDMEMLSKTRETYGPYVFPISSIEKTFTYEIYNYQNRALYRACQEADADAVIEPLFNVSVYDKDPNSLVVEVSGYPVKYVNFRPATKSEIDMIGVVYPTANTSVSVNSALQTEAKTTK